LLREMVRLWGPTQEANSQPPAQEGTEVGAIAPSARAKLRSDRPSDEQPTTEPPSTEPDDLRVILEAPDAKAVQAWIESELARAMPPLRPHPFGDRPFFLGSDNNYQVQPGWYFFNQGLQYPILTFRVLSLGDGRSQVRFESSCEESSPVALGLMEELGRIWPSLKHRGGWVSGSFRFVKFWEDVRHAHL